MTESDLGTTSIETGLKELEALIKKISADRPDWNEADTRFQFIDPFITDCLGWPRYEMKLERRQDNAYTDYELGSPRATIWEAKREGVYFELPANPSQRSIGSLKSIMSLDENAASAIKQVQSYCSARGTPVAVVCNGHQLIAFLASRQDGQSPLEGLCIFINGHEQFIKEFPLLWQNLSPAGIKERRIIRLLTTGAEAAPKLTPVKPAKDELALTPEIMAEALSRRPIVLIGDVGVGKTSFLKHLMYVSAFDEFQRAIYVYIDLGSQAALEHDLKDFILAEIERQLLDRYNVDVNESHFVKGVY